MSTNHNDTNMNKYVSEKRGNTGHFTQKIERDKSRKDNTKGAYKTEGKHYPESSELSRYRPQAIVETHGVQVR